MLGAIAGDMIGSTFEAFNHKSKDFTLFRWGSRFTDDTVLTVAVADALLHRRDYGECYRQYFRRYPLAGFGKSFTLWAAVPGSRPYNSWGNGAAMRVSPVGWVHNHLDEVLAEAQRSAEVTHNHPEGIRGAQATAAAVFLARQGATKAEIKTCVETRFGYDLSRTLDQIRPYYRFDVSCQGSVPQAIMAFLESMDFEDAIRNAVSLGGDSDTLACIAGGIAEAYYGGVPESIADHVWRRLDAPLQAMVTTFRQHWGRQHWGRQP